MLSKSAIRYSALATCLLAGEVPAAEATLQDLQVVGRAITFRDGSGHGSMSLAIVYNSASAQSQGERRAAEALLRGGLKVGDRVFSAVSVEQSAFGSASGYDGVFTTSDVDQTKLRAALGGKGVPCFTLDDQQVKNGACTVAVRSRPSVVISINSRNAAAAGVRFATAFIMMVREI